jgi:oxygen-independent coproporphyrinogen-3 oxidase
VRLREGLALGDLSEATRETAAQLVESSLLDAVAYADGRAALTLRGRLLADAVVRELVD